MDFLLVVQTYDYSYKVYQYKQQISIAQKQYKASWLDIYMLMKTVKLYHILFEADDATMSLDIGKDVSDAVTVAIEPVTKDVEQMKKDINVIQHATATRKQEPTNARSTTGASQTASATTEPKGPGTKSTTGTSGGTKTGGTNDVDALRKDMEQIKTQVGSLSNMAKKAQGSG